MTKTEEIETSSKIDLEQDIKLPGFQRDIFPTNIALSAKDICKLSKIIKQANDNAIKVELETVNENAEDRAERIDRIKELMKVEYILRAQSGDNIKGLESPVEEDFPDKVASFFISSNQYAIDLVNNSPMNHVNAFLSFEQPSMKIDLITLPSNPTENRSVINIVGRDEDWVRATADELEEFFDKKKTIRPVIHGSGAYDFFLFILYLPIIIGFFARYDKQILPWLSEKSFLFNVIFGIYLFFLTLIFARVVFQFIRWLLPPIEYYKTSQTKANTLRFVSAGIMGTLLVSGLYDFGKYIIFLIF